MARTKATAKRNTEPAGRALAVTNKATDKEKVKKPHRYRPGTVALREIRRYQKSVDCLIPKKSVTSLIREITQDYGEFRYRMGALEAIREAGEQFLANLFTDTQLAAVHARRVTIMDKDMRFIVKMLASHGHSLFVPCAIPKPRTHYSQREPHPFPAKKERAAKAATEAPPQSEDAPAPQHGTLD